MAGEHATRDGLGLMKRVPIARVSQRQRDRAATAPKVPKMARCGWCLREYATEMDHIVPRSLLPGENRDHADGLMPSCRRCNRRRAAGWKPRWSILDSHQQRFVLQQKGAVFAGRYFTDVPA